MQKWESKFTVILADDIDGFEEYWAEVCAIDEQSAAEKFVDDRQDCETPENQEVLVKDSAGVVTRWNVNRAIEISFHARQIDSLPTGEG